MRYGPGYSGMNFGIFIIIPAILFTIILIIALIYLLIRILKYGHLNGHCFSTANLGLTDSTSKALEILNIRYANGEITDEEHTIKKEQILK